MSSYVRLAADTADRYFAALAGSQEHFLNTVSALASWAPNAAAGPGCSAGAWTPQELSNASFAFAEKLLQQQKDFVQKVVAVTRSGDLRKGIEGERAAVSAVPAKDSRSEPIAMRAPTHDRPDRSQRSSSKRTASETGRIAVAKPPSALPTTAVSRRSRKSGR
jgi:hypothetical protein